MGEKRGVSDLIVECVPRGGSGILGRTAWTIAALIGWLMDSALSGTGRGLVLHDVVIRRADGTELARGGVGVTEREWLLDELERDRRRLSEQRFLEKWLDSSRWQDRLHRREAG